MLKLFTVIFLTLLTYTNLHDISYHHFMLIPAIIKVESNGDAKAVSNKGAIGLMQIRYSVWKKELKKQGIIKTRKCLFNPEKNVKAGKFILASYIKKSPNLEIALYKYSGGSKAYYNKVIKELNK